MRAISKFTQGILALLAAAGALVSGYIVINQVGVIPILIFGLKSWLLGMGFGVVAKSKKRTVAKETKYRRKYIEIDDPSGPWFILGFASITAFVTVLLVTGVLAITTFSIFLFGFLLVFSGAIDEKGNARKFVDVLSVLIFLGAVTIAALFVFDLVDDVLSFLSRFFP